MERYEMIHLPGETAWYTGTTVETGPSISCWTCFHWVTDNAIPSPGKSSEAAPGNSGQLKEEALPEELSRLGDLGKPVFHTVPLKRPRAACSASSLELHRNPPRTALLHAKSLQSCSTLCNPMNYNSTGPSVRGILQARILEKVLCRSLYIGISQLRFKWVVLIEK